MARSKRAALSRMLFRLVCRDILSRDPVGCKSFLPFGHVGSFFRSACVMSKGLCSKRSCAAEAGGKEEKASGGA